MKNKKIALIFWLWLVLITIELFSVNLLQIRYPSLWDKIYWLFRIFNKVSCFFLPLIVLIMDNSFLKKAFITSAVILWVLVLSFIVGPLYKLPQINIDLSMYTNTALSSAVPAFIICYGLVAIFYFIIGFYNRPSVLKSGKEP